MEFQLSDLDESTKWIIDIQKRRFERSIKSDRMNEKRQRRKPPLKIAQNRKKMSK